MSVENDLEQLIDHDPIQPSYQTNHHSRGRRSSWSNHHYIIGLLALSLVCMLGVTAVITLSNDLSVDQTVSPSISQSSSPYFKLHRVNQSVSHSRNQPPMHSSVPAALQQLNQSIIKSHTKSVGQSLKRRMTSPSSQSGTSPYVQLMAPLESTHAEDCRAMHPTAQSWSEPPYHKRVFIAANLHNNKGIMIDWMTEVQRTIASICERSIYQSTSVCPNVYVSLYVSSSSDPQTQSALDLFAAYLTSMNIKHTIISRGLLNRGHRERIEHLADVRNAAMSSFAKADAAGYAPFDHVLFLNDVMFCSEDAIRLLTLTDQAKASMSCGLDFDDIQMQNEARYYDIWVGRSITGRASKKTHPFFKDDYSQAAVNARQPFRVFCCWNGMVAIDANEFRQPDALSFRARDRLIDLNDKQSGNKSLNALSGARFVPRLDACESSECSHLCEDMWSKHGSETRILLDPTVHVAYVPRVLTAIRNQPWYRPVDRPRPFYDENEMINGTRFNSTALLTRTDDGISWWCCNLDWKCQEHEVKFLPGVH